MFRATQLAVTMAFFYDAETSLAGIFHEFLAIPFLTQDVYIRSGLSLIRRCL